ncbi:hypothetical protein M758_7G170800 [Ceratodon purpureus]|nr:hypothetical protein M758_7G170800 [Ceratodon purpureus]
MCSKVNHIEDEILVVAHAASSLLTMGRNFMCTALLYNPWHLLTMASTKLLRAPVKERSSHGVAQDVSTQLGGCCLRRGGASGDCKLCGDCECEAVGGRYPGCSPREG